MKIVFLNVWGDQMQDQLVGYLEEQARDTDIFCFQEATDNMKQRCSEVLSNYTEVSDRKFISVEDDLMQATFIKKDIQLLSSGSLMANTDGAGFAIYTEIKTKNGATYICNVHGKARPGDKLDDPGRLVQSTEIIDSFKDKDCPIIIGGDFNILPDTKSIRMFEEHGYRNLIQEFSIDTTRNHLSWDRFPTKMYYSDYVFLNDKIQLKSFTVPKNEVSDHLPMLLEIDI